MSEVEKEFNIEDAVDAAAVSSGLMEEAPEAESHETVSETATERAPITEAALEAPQSWTAEAKARWGALDPALQKELHKRESDNVAGISKYKTGFELAEKFNEGLKPYEAIFKANPGMDPVVMSRNMMSTHFAMVYGKPEQKLQIASRLLRDYGIDPIQFVSYMATGQAPAGAAAASAPNPEVAALKEELATLKQGLTQVSEFRNETVKERITTQVSDFATAVDDKGQPAHPWFEEVADDVIRRIGQGLPLEKAYEEAVWSNPAVRQKEIARASAAPQVEAQADAARRAKANSVNVRTTDSQASGATPKKAESWQKGLEVAAEKLFGQKVHV